MGGAWNLDQHAGRARWRRVLLSLLVAAVALLGGVLMWIALGAGVPTLLEAACLALWVPAFAGIALSFWAGVIGFVLGVLRRHPITLSRHGPASGPVPSLVQRTAILVPIYNEDALAVMSRLERLWQSLAATRPLHALPFFGLSDTTHSTLPQAGPRTWASLRARRRP